jgi:hydrogenase maturation protein HypF
MGRLFDAVAAILGVRTRVTYEGQAAIELELLAEPALERPWPWRFGDSTALVERVAFEAARGRSPAAIASAFHQTIAQSAAEACADAADGLPVVLSGGTFQNRLLAKATRARLEGYGFRVLEHERVPANDGGISYGQAAVAASRLASCA